MKRYKSGVWEDSMQHPPEEMSLRLIVNGIELVTVQCSPDGCEDLGVGFLFTSGIIERTDEIRAIDFSPEADALSVTLTKAEFPMPRRLIITSGFGGGPVFDAQPPAGRLESNFSMSPDRLIALMSEMKSKAVLYQKSGGIHASALCAADGLVCMAEDVGRQNSMDKVIGSALRSGATFSGKALLTTGRISFEMVLKTLRAGISLLASLSSPTVKAVQLAEDSGLTIAGYVSGEGFIAYSNESGLRP